MSMYGKNHYNIVISLQQIKIKGKKFFLIFEMVKGLKLFVEEMLGNYPTS